ncbi:hypothetical protein E1200_06835 [Actinomadura sp. GC306]|uniref:hypothetical protein n=1 Tax=Actinomadura sp. GC306 TaxID=2530367 RepID=UPI00104A710C|nr:hypothetical protein [Actinomadura sp. GC306]TDC69903.1 hypothetical protein E1200_06835 [Actinomadura sp. GC306]
MVDEMDLLRRLKDAEPVRPRAFDEARAVLQAAMEDEEPKTQSASRRRWGGRRTVGFGAAAALVAAAVAVAVAGTSASAPAKPPAEAANPILTALVADITPLQSEMPGDATLVEVRNQSPTGAEIGGNGIGLFTDDGTYYWGNDKKALRRAVVKNMGDDVFKGPIAAALYAVKGDIGTARARMASAGLTGNTMPDLERERAERLKGYAKERGERYVPPEPPTAEQKKQITDNHIWSNSIDALVAAPENPQVRAGVLRIMATMPRVDVTKSTTAGRSTLTLVNSWPANGRFKETLVIDAKTGRPVAFSGTAPGTSATTLYYHTSRATLADVRSGKF